MRKDKTHIQAVIDEKNLYRKSLKEIKNLLEQGELGIHRSKDKLIDILDKAGIYIKRG